MSFAYSRRKRPRNGGGVRFLSCNRRSRAVCAQREGSKKKCENKTKNTARGACFKSKPQFLTIWGSSQPKRVLLGSDPDHRFSDTVELLFSLFLIYRPGKMFIFGGFRCIPHPLLVWLISLPVNTLGYTQVSLFIPISQRNYFVSHNSTVWD